MNQTELKIVPLGGGAGHVNTNMYLYQYGLEGLIIDCGIGFPSDQAETNDLLLPDISYLKKNRLNLHGIVLTHGHDDHHAALPYILPSLGSVPVYGSRLTIGFAQDRLSQANFNLKLNLLKATDKLKLGPFIIEPVFVTHSIPDTYHLAIHTPVGTVYHGSDFKFDLTPIDHRPPDFQKIARLGQKGILCLLSDCLNSESAGFCPSESILTDVFHREIHRSPGRVIITLMSSSIHRIQQAVNVAVKYQRQIAFIGRSLETNVQTASRLGFLKLPRKSIISKKRIKSIPDQKLCLIIAGSQAQESSSFSRYALNQHRLLKPKSNDKVIISADIIPGNEEPVYHLVDQLSKQKINVSYMDLIDDLHVSGHAYAKELQLLINLTTPKFLYPFGAPFRQVNRYYQLALELNYHHRQVILPQTGQIVKLTASQYQLGQVLKLKEIRLKQDR